MRFGQVVPAQAVGAILAHAVRAPGVNLRKGELIAPGHVALLQAAGIGSVFAAVLEAGDVGEDEAAGLIAHRLAGPGVRYETPFTGRCNLLAEVAGLACVSGALIDAVNAEDEAVTVATVRPMQPVLAGEMIAVVKIIPFALPGELMGRTLRAAAKPSITVAPFLPLRVAVVSTLLPGLKRAAVERTLRLLDDRLAPTGATVIREQRVAHEPHALAAAIRSCRDCDLLILIGASAIADRRDVLPLAIALGGGRVDHLGMPVDPGSMLLLGSMVVDPSSRVVPIIGAPGCIRSPNAGSFDLVLHRLLAGFALTGADLRAMGVGGLIGEPAMSPAASRRIEPTAQGLAVP